MNRKRPYSSKHLLAGLAGLALSTTAATAQITLNGLIAEESFDGYSSAFLNGQATSSTTGFAGTETWGGTASIDARGARGAPANGLSYPGLSASGGSALVYRTTTFNDTSTHTFSLSTSTPLTNITNTELYFSFIINADNYVLRAGDTAAHGVTVNLIHGSTGAAPNIGVFFGGTNGELGINYRGTGNAIQMTGLSLQPGNNLVVLGVNAHSANPTATYSLWLNPDLSTNIRDTATIGAADYDFDTAFGVVTGNASFGFLGWGVQQRFNGVQSVYIDELRLGETFADAVVIPEPSTYALLFGAIVLAIAGIRRRARSA
ncbi:MAG: PEP-CTERM sorting domain-containing protein [Opitutales bacterium]|nr:PEP-CTERM sorting domain-containing protein [Opitutales bacterium]